jgi:predicted DNA-binding protein (UPF0251 family)
MPRHRNKRKIMKPPRFKGYKPYGYPGTNSDPVELLFEEYEAIKMADYQLMNHEDAGRLMGVSRATFARIYENARRKIAKALVETREIKTSMGDIFFDKEWYLCNDCNERFSKKENKNKENCPTCKSEDLTLLKN